MNNYQNKFLQMSDFVCEVCQVPFPSRNKLFVHIRNTHDERKIHGKTVLSSTSTTTTKSDDAIVVVYEDDWCRIFNKPQGLPTMGAKGKSLLNNSCLLIKENFIPGVKYRKTVPCHRLDSATGGILICSKSKVAENLIQYCFREKLVQKRYLAIVVGKLQPTEGMITSKIDGKISKTLYKVQSYTNTPHACEYLTTVSLWPITGRRHQLRKQLSELGCPILGDRRYSFANQWVDPIDRLYLWAVELWLPHPKQLHVIGLDALIHRHFLPTTSGTTDDEKDKKTAKSKSCPDSDEEDGEEEKDDGYDVNNGNEEKSEDKQSQPSASTVMINNRSHTAVVQAMAVNIDDYFQQALRSYQLDQAVIYENILHLSIPEPLYYEEFRSQQQLSFHQLYSSPPHNL